MTLSRHRGSVPVLARLFTGEADPRIALLPGETTDGFTRRSPLRARPPFTRPWPPFLERVCRAYSRPDVAYRLLQLHFDVRATKPELFSPRRDGGLDLLPFLDASRPLSCESGDTRRAAPRPFGSVPVLVPLAFASLPNRDTDSSASPPKLSPQSVVRIDEHGSKDRVKDASLRRARSLVLAVRCMPLGRMLMTFPSSATFGHPLSSAERLDAEDAAS
jgi:hypothetical protein